MPEQISDPTGLRSSTGYMPVSGCIQTQCIVTADTAQIEQYGLIGRRAPRDLKKSAVRY